MFILVILILLVAKVVVMTWALQLSFKIVTGSAIEFRDALHMIAEGKVNVGPMITGTVGLSGVDEAFAALGNPEQHAKILIDPGKA